MFKYVPLLLLTLPFLSHTSDYVAIFTHHWIVILCGNDPQESVLLDKTRSKMKADGCSAQEMLEMETAGKTKAREVLKNFDIRPASF
jgi:hypothetical protein